MDRFAVGLCAESVFREVAAASKAGKDNIVRATWNGAVIAESNETIVVEGNHYFPCASVHPQFLRPSETHTICPWKGTASYYTLEVNGQRNDDAAWYYAEPKAAAREIKGHVAFWKGVRVGP